MDYKKIAKYAGKTAATIVCPPLVGWLWMKKRGDKFGGIVVGVVVSLVSVIGMQPSSQKQIYDNPSVRTRKEIDSLINVGEALTSPIAFYFDTPVKTKLEKKAILEKGVTSYSIYPIWGNDVVTFNNGKYDLNFDGNRKFGNSFRGKSVVKAEEQLEKYRKLIFDYKEKGKIFSARRAKESLNKAQTNLEAITKEYNKTKAVFQEAVDTMNSELECLAQGAQGKN